MNSRERVKKCLEFETPDKVPRDLWTLPYVSVYQKDDLEDLLKKYPLDICTSETSLGSSKKLINDCSKVGKYEDGWGSIWYVAEPGVLGEVKKPAIDDWLKLDNFKPPYNLIKEKDLDYINRFYDESDKFIISCIAARPFERMQFLRGTQSLYMDIAYDETRFYKLLEMVHDYYIKDVEDWCKTAVDGIFFMDDWGTNDSLLIDPEKWRKIFKPLYKDYCDIIHNSGKFAFFHSDGCIESIYGDLIEIGIDAVNSQLFVNNIEEIGKKYKGKITFWGEMDRQHILPFGNEDDVRKAVKRIKDSLYDKKGGLIAQCEWGKCNPRENIISYFEAWEE